MSKSLAKNGNKITKHKFLLEVRSLLITAMIFVFITAALVEGSIVPTPSMEKTIMTGDRLFINKAIFGITTPTHIPFTNIDLPYYRLPAFREPERNEIIVFRYPGDKNQLVDDAVEFWVKRCLAIPGDTIEFRNKVVYVNGKRSPIPVNINYQLQPIKRQGVKDSEIFPITENWNGDNYGPLVIPKKGDVIELNMSNIHAWKMIINREFGEEVVQIDGNEIKINGKINNKYTLKQDYYFMIGDNRDNSLDSRYWGFVPRENIVGTPMIIFWSWDSTIPFSKPLDLISSIRFERIAKLVK